MEDIGLCNICEGKICAEEGECVSAVKRKKRRDA